MLPESVVNLQERQASLNRDRKAIHRFGYVVQEARERAAAARIRLQALESSASGQDQVLSFALVFLLLFFFVADLTQTGPHMKDRFEQHSIDPLLAWMIAAVVSALILCLEIVAGTLIWDGRRRGLETGYWGGYWFWLFAGAVLVAVSFLFGHSLYLLFDPETDVVRSEREIILAILFSLGHLVLVASGRYLTPAKTALGRTFGIWFFRHRLTAAERAARKAHRQMSEVFQTYWQRFQHWRVPGGPEWSLVFGPFEAGIVELIKERGFDELSLDPSAAVPTVTVPPISSPPATGPRVTGPVVASLPVAQRQPVPEEVGAMDPPFL